MCVYCSVRLDGDGELVLRRFGQINELLVASPGYLNRRGRPLLPAELVSHSTLSMSEEETRQRWTLYGPGDAIERVEIQPSLMTHDFPLLIAAAKAGLGIALLPESVCADAVRSGDLGVVVPDWHLPCGVPVTARTVAGRAGVH